MNPFGDFFGSLFQPPSMRAAGQLTALAPFAAAAQNQQETPAEQQEYGPFPVSYSPKNLPPYQPPETIYGTPDKPLTNVELRPVTEGVAEGYAAYDIFAPGVDDSLGRAFNKADVPLDEWDIQLPDGYYWYNGPTAADQGVVDTTALNAEKLATPWVNPNAPVAAEPTPEPMAANGLDAQSLPGINGLPEEMMDLLAIMFGDWSGLPGDAKPTIANWRNLDPWLAGLFGNSQV